MGEVQDALEAHLHALAGPFLFVGAGLSMRYAGLPNWEGLLREFAQYTPHQFEYYFGAAESKLPLTASKIAEDFYEVWWNDERFAESRNQFGKLVTSGSSALKIEMANFVQRTLASNAVPAELLDEWNLLTCATVDGVITTNYDALLESAFPEYQVFVGQSELIFSDSQGVGEIYHIHGAATDPESMVLTGDDYADFDARDKYLAAKLLTIFVEHPVVFLGYSMGDKNIQLIIENIVHGLTDKNVSKLAQRLIFVEWEAGVTPSYSDSVLMYEGASIPITRIKVNDFREVFAALGARERAIPARMVRLLQDQIYNLFLTNDPKKLLHAYSDVNSVSAKDMSVVFGIGAKSAIVGLTAVSRAEMLADVIGNPIGGYEAHEVIEKYIGQLRTTDWFPVFKYLNDAGFLNAAGSIKDESALPAKVAAHAKRNIEKVVRKVAHRRRTDMATLLTKHDWKWVFTNVLVLPSYTNDVEGIRQFLVDHQDKYLIRRWSTDYAKTVVVYDLLKYGPKA